MQPLEIGKASFCLLLLHKLLHLLQAGSKNHAEDLEFTLRHEMTQALHLCGLGPFNPQLSVEGKFYHVNIYK